MNGQLSREDADWNRKMVNWSSKQGIFYDFNIKHREFTGFFDGILPSNRRIGI